MLVVLVVQPKVSVVWLTLTVRHLVYNSFKFTRDLKCHSVNHNNKVNLQSFRSMLVHKGLPFAKGRTLHREEHLSDISECLC